MINLTQDWVQWYVLYRARNFTCWVNIIFSRLCFTKLLSYFFTMPYLSGLWSILLQFPLSSSCYDNSKYKWWNLFWRKRPVSQHTPFYSQQCWNPFTRIMVSNEWLWNFTQDISAKDPNILFDLGFSNLYFVPNCFTKHIVTPLVTLKLWGENYLTYSN